MCHSSKILFFLFLNRAQWRARNFFGIALATELPYMSHVSGMRIYRNRPFALCLILAIFSIQVFHCKNQLSTQQLLDGNFITSGQTAIDLLQPTQNQQVTPANLTFSWGARNAKLYTLEIATDAGFSNKVLSKDVADTRYVLANSDLQGVSTLVTSMYYWRVRIAAISNNLQSVTNAFYLFAIPSSGSGYAGVVYVDVNGTGFPVTGGKNNPFRSIQAAILNIDVLRSSNPAVAVDIYVATGTYYESITILPGFSILGGYEPVNWTRNITANPVTIKWAPGYGVYGDSRITSAYTATTVIDGLNIIPDTGINGSGISMSNASPTITNCYINGDNNPGFVGVSHSSNGIVLNGSTGTSSAIIRNNVVIASNSCSPSCGTFFAINVQTGATIANNIITGGNVTGANIIVGILVTGSDNFIIENNTILGGSVSSSSQGIYINNYSGILKIQNNTIFNQRNNGTSGFGYCINEANSTSSPTLVQNNNLFGCQYLYRDNGGAGDVANLTTALTSPSGTLQSMGNVSIDNTGGQLFADINGADGSISTLTDNDWRLTQNAAVCNIRGGGLNLSSSITTDKDGLNRTISAIAGCTPGNMGAANWSIGAYEKD